MPINWNGFDKVMISWRGFCFGQRIILTHLYDLAEAVPVPSEYPQEMQTLITLVSPATADSIGQAYLACLPASYRLTEIRAQRIHQTRNAYVARAFNAPGTHNAAASVANDAACLTFRTLLAGRREVANKHIGPVPDAASASGLLTQAYKDLLEALGDAMLQTLVVEDVGHTWVPCIYHRENPGALSEIEGFVIGDQSRVQRRRTVGLGE